MAGCLAGCLSNGAYGQLRRLAPPTSSRTTAHVCIRKKTLLESQGGFPGAAAVCSFRPAAGRSTTNCPFFTASNAEDLLRIRGV